MRGSKLVIQIVVIREFTHLEELIGAPGDTVCPFKHLLKQIFRAFMFANNRDDPALLVKSVFIFSLSVSFSDTSTLIPARHLRCDLYHATQQQERLPGAERARSIVRNRLTR